MWLAIFRVGQHDRFSHVAVKANLTKMCGQVKLRRNGPEPMCPSRLMAIRPSLSACASGPPTRLGVSASQASSARLVEPVGAFNHPLRQIKTPLEAASLAMWLAIFRVGLCPSRLMAIRPSLSACASGPPTRLGVSASQASSARLVEPVGAFNHPLRQIKTPLEAASSFGGEGGIRTHVPGLPDHLISSQRRYGHFGTSPDSCAILPAMCSIANLHTRSFGYCR